MNLPRSSGCRRRGSACKAYDASTLRYQLQDKAVRIYTPRKYRRSTLPPGFRYDAKADWVICPAGATALPTPHPAGGAVYVFAQRTCQRCAHKAVCLTDGRKRQRV